MHLELRYDLRAPDFGASAGDLYRACLEQCAWADEVGFDAVRLTEHHAVEDGYCPSPIVLASAIAGATKNLRLRLCAIVLPLHDPVRLAEDIAVLDLVSAGRVELVVAGGYRAEEFALFERELSDRPRLLEDGVDVLRRSWRGEPVERSGSTVTVTPRPHQPDGPPIVMGGASLPAARRAARIGDGFYGTVPGFEDTYRAECERQGTSPWTPWAGSKSIPCLFLHVTDDPEKDWDVVGPHVLHETNSYAAWFAEAGVAGPFLAFDGVDALRRSGLYRFMTPNEVVDALVDIGPDAALSLNPLVGGLAPEHAWKSLELVEREVLPALATEGMLG